MADVVTEAGEAARPRSVAMNVDTGEKTWLTPRCILDPRGRFDLDPCCPDGGMPWRTADRMVTKDEDGLRQDWEGLRVWLNPPYGREAEPFFRKLVSRSRGGGVALVFARTDTKLWQDYIFPNAHSVLFLRRRVRFCRQDGTPGETATAPSALISFSAEDADVLARAVDPLRPDALSGFVVSLRR